MSSSSSSSSSAPPTTNREIAVQLRRLRSAKERQDGELDRLQRQIRILSDLRGVSTDDVKDALRRACEGEAHGELRAVVGTLRARVDGLESGGGGGGKLDDDAVARKSIPTQEQFDREAAARARSALELRIGELEEVEWDLRREVDGLYETSRGLTERNTFLETQLLQKKAQLEQWERRWKAKEEEEIRKGSIVPFEDAPTASSGSYNYSDVAAASDDGAASRPMLLHNAPQAEVDAAHERRLLAAQAALNGEKQQLSLVKSRLSSTQKSYQLKVEQYQHRIKVLEEQLRDLEQQMSSMYVAFGIMEKDGDEVRRQKEEWRSTLLESDAAIAQQETRREKLQYTSMGRIDGERKLKSDRSRRGLTKLLSPPSIPKAAVKPAGHPPIAGGHLLLLLDKDDQVPQPGDAPATPRSKRKLSLKLKSPSGTSASAVKFKKQYCVLHGANGLYQLRYGDDYEGPVSGVHEFITTGVSSIDHDTPRSSGQQFGFEIMINASVEDAPALCCAAETEADFMMWMGALTSVIDGSLDD